MAVRVKVRRDIAASWTAANPVLDPGEFGYETDTSRIKVGNGATTWNLLLYLGQTSPNLLADFTFAQATASSSALAVANKYSEIVISDRGVAGQPAYSDGIDWRFYSDNLVIT